MSVTTVDFDGKNLPVDFVRSSGSQVQTRIKKKTIIYEENVCVRMKTHFENSKYLESFTVPAKTTVRENHELSSTYFLPRNSSFLTTSFLIIWGGDH